jgi:hypothetical protein
MLILLWPMLLAWLFYDVSFGSLDEPDAPEILFASAERLATEQEGLGARLEALLAGEHRDRRDRLRAAKALGALRYVPAIPTLIRHIELRGRWSEVRFSPVGEALARYGDVAVPALVRSYLKEDVTFNGSVRAHLILYTFREGKTVATARTYALGMAAEGDAAMKERVEWFVEELDARQENRVPQHKPPVHNINGKR